MSTTDKLLVLGAGPIGLCVAKALKSHGIAYDQVDASDGIGGNWHHGVYEAAHIISSRRTTEFPDYPMPASFSDFPSRKNMLDYLNAYAQHFRLFDSIQLRQTVTSVAPLPNGTWRVRFGEEETRDYRGVIVCNGHHWNCRWPDYPGKITTEYIHSKDYVTPDQLRGKRVLVIGGGNSACDIVSEAARVGASAHLSLRRGYWFLPKVLFGRPTVELICPWIPLRAQRLLIRMALKVAVGNYRQYGLPPPDHKIFDHHPTISSEVLHYLRHGRITVHPDIQQFDGNTVEFIDGTRDPFDIVVAATGFHVSFPFLAPGLVPLKGPVAEVYGGMMTAEHRHLYIVGWMQPRYGFGPLIVPAADLLARIILSQERMRNPFGLILKRLGQKPAQTHLFDPNRTKLEIRLARPMLPIIRFVDRWMG